ncbi:MAG: pseudouridine synthase [Velocimicrobium sp.]
MTESLRLDKYLADMGIGTRSEIKNMIRKSLVLVNGEVEKKSERKIIPAETTVICNGMEIIYHSYEYFMLNKPAGIITATMDKKESTVLDLLDEVKRKDLFPVGRLDKDTEGLLLITNDGDLAHELLSPKKHVAKTYFARVVGRVIDADVSAFEEGVWIEHGIKTKPAELKILQSDAISEVLLTIYEGKFHQVKRMFEAVDKKVLYLKRISMGTLTLDETLKVGEYRLLTETELKELKTRRTYVK